MTRCISLLKILLTNFCLFDCLYCVNRASSNVKRARFSVSEIVSLTLDFYRRNYIEGLFLSSGVIQSPDYTMEQMVRVARELREAHEFRGYIHLKLVPEADPDLIEQAGRYADRISLNVELPTETSLSRLAPQKRMPAIRKSIASVTARIDDAHDARRKYRSAPAFAPAGQSTQMIVGADAENDISILRTSINLYAGYRLKRVYYSAFSPIPAASAQLPPTAPPLLREHRLYQADWLVRFYGFSLDDIAASTPSGMFDPDVDPKLAWALANRALFPMDVNRADRDHLLRVPGLGVRVVDRILESRRFGRLRLDDLKRLGVRLRKTAPFIIAGDWRPHPKREEQLLPSLRSRPRQLDLFGAA